MAQFVVFHVPADVDRAHYVANLIEGHWAVPAALDRDGYATDLGEHTMALGLWTERTRDPTIARMMTEKLARAERAFILVWGGPTPPESFDHATLIGEAGPDAAALRMMAARMEGKRTERRTSRKSKRGSGGGVLAALTVVAAGAGGVAWAMSSGLIQNPLSSSIADLASASSPASLAPQRVAATMPSTEVVEPPALAEAAPAEAGMEGGVRVARLEPRAAVEPEGPPVKAAPIKAGPLNAAPAKPAAVKPASKPAAPAVKTASAAKLAPKPALALSDGSGQATVEEKRALVYGPGAEEAPASVADTEEKPKKRGLIGRLLGRGDDNDDD